MSRLLSLLLLLFIPLLNVQANPLFEGFTAEYDVIRNDLNLGVTKRQLIKHDAHSLEFLSRTEPEGLVALLISDVFDERSVIQLDASGVRPLEYTYQQSGGKTKKSFKAEFDWDKHQLHRSNSNETDALPDNTQDLLSFQLAILDGLYKKQHHFNFTIVDHKRIQEHQLDYSGMERLPGSNGGLNVLRLDHKDTRKKDHFTFWCAEKYHYLPVRIQKVEHDGDVVLLKLRRFNGRRIDLSD